jgi:hypothetical protein
MTDAFVLDTIFHGNRLVLISVGKSLGPSYVLLFFITISLVNLVILYLDL